MRSLHTTAVALWALLSIACSIDPSVDAEASDDGAQHRHADTRRRDAGISTSDNVQGDVRRDGGAEPSSPDLETDTADGGAGIGSGAGEEPEPGGGGSDEPQELPEPLMLRGITAAHNDVRANVVPPAVTPLAPLTWSPHLAATAQAYAERCIWQHSSNGYGENLWAATYAPTGDDVVALWAAEAQSYDHENNACTGVCGHYTQIVWESTTELGCGVKHCTDGIDGLSWPSGYIVVCNYDPPGNYWGQRPYQAR